MEARIRRAQRLNWLVNIPDSNRLYCSILQRCPCKAQTVLPSAGGFKLRPMVAAGLRQVKFLRVIRTSSTATKTKVRAPPKVTFTPPRQCKKRPSGPFFLQQQRKNQKSSSTCPSLILNSRFCRYALRIKTYLSPVMSFSADSKLARVSITSMPIAMLRAGISFM